MTNISKNMLYPEGLNLLSYLNIGRVNIIEEIKTVL